MLSRILSYALLSVVISVGGATAQDLRSADEPAEFPPSSFTGTQFADSRGCVYVRAGFAGQVRWIPRVTRGRKQVCGVAPTFGKKKREAEPVIAEAPQPTEAPVRATSPRRAEAVTAVKPETAATPKPKRTQRKSQNVGKPIETIATTTKPPRIGRQANTRATPSPAPEPTVVSEAKVAQVAPGKEPRPKKQKRVAAKPSPAPAPTVFSNTPVEQVAEAKEPKPAKQRRVATKPSPAPAPTVVSTPAVEQVNKEPKPTRKAQRRVAAKPSPAPAPTVFSNPPEDNIAPSRTGRIVQLAGDCGARTGVSAQYTNTKGVRCGPQQQDYITSTRVVVTEPAVEVATAPAPAPKATKRKSKSTPKPVATADLIEVIDGSEIKDKPARKAKKAKAKSKAKAPSKPVEVVVNVPRKQKRAPKPPKGYKSVWDDGRLNPNRGERTPEGRRQMALLWTQETPHRLIDVRTGQDVTALFPNLTYPNVTSTGKGKVTVAAKGSTKKSAKTKRARVSTKAVKSKKPKAVVKQATAKRKTKKKTTKVAVKAAPKKVAKAASHRFVQVGTFGVSANAKNTAKRLQALGLPVRLAGMKSKGRSLQIVLAGPFNSQAQLNKALKLARGAGFSDAFLRK